MDVVLWFINLVCSVVRHFFEKILKFLDVLDVVNACILPLLLTDSRLNRFLTLRQNLIFINSVFFFFFFQIRVHF